MFIYIGVFNTLYFSKSIWFPYSKLNMILPSLSTIFEFNSITDLFQLISAVPLYGEFYFEILHEMFY